MDDALTSEELFVLRITAADRVPLRLLSLDGQGMREQWFPFHSPDVDHTLVPDAVTKLAGRKFVKIESDDGMQIVEITKEGAENWETTCKPDWSKFMVQRSHELREDVSRISIMCGSESLRAAAIGISVSCLGLCPDFGIRKIRFKRRTSWQATYWKTLATGFFVSFSARLDNRPSCENSDVVDCTLFLPWGRMQSEW